MPKGLEAGLWATLLIATLVTAAAVLPPLLAERDQGEQLEGSLKVFDRFKGYPSPCAP